MEEENKNEDLQDLMSKIEEAVAMSEKRQDDIDKKLKKLAQKKKIMEYEELKKEIEADESSKSEFDEMTVSGLIRAKKEVLKQKDALQKSLKENMTKAQEDYNKAYAETQLIKQHAERTLKNYEEKGNPETIERAKRAAQKAIGNAEKNLDDATKKFLGIQTEHKDKMSKLDEHEAKITSIADKLGVLNEINAVKIEEKKEQVAQAQEVEPEEKSTNQEEVNQEAVEPQKEVAPEESAEVVPVETEWSKDEEKQMPEEINEEVVENPEAVVAQNSEEIPIEEWFKAEEEHQVSEPTSETVIGNITIKNNQATVVGKVGKDDYKQKNPLYNETELEEFLEEFRNSKSHELYTEDSLKQIYNDSRVDRNILVGLLVNKMQLATYLSALGYENLLELSSDFNVIMPEIEYDLKDKRGTKIAERYEIYKSALETKRLFEEQGLEPIEIKTNFMDKGIFAVMGAFETLKQRLQKTKAIPEETTSAQERQGDEEIALEREESFQEKLADREGDEKRSEISKKANEKETLVEEKIAETAEELEFDDFDPF